MQSWSIRVELQTGRKCPASPVQHTEAESSTGEIAIAVDPLGFTRCGLHKEWICLGKLATAVEEVTQIEQVISRVRTLFYSLSVVFLGGLDVAESLLGSRQIRQDLRVAGCELQGCLELFVRLGPLVILEESHALSHQRSEEHTSELQSQSNLVC